MNRVIMFFWVGPTLVYGSFSEKSEIRKFWDSSENLDTHIPIFQYCQTDV